MSLLHDAYSAYLSGIATMDDDGWVHWDDCKIKILDAENEEYTIIDTHGTQDWYKNGLLHREAIWPDGTQYWYKNGKFHRENGPAVIWSDGTQQWWENGKRIK